MRHYSILEYARNGTPLAFSVKAPTGPDAIDCDRIIARLGATPPRSRTS